jgi:hypothetical protein
MSAPAAMLSVAQASDMASAAMTRIMRMKYLPECLTFDRIEKQCDTRSFQQKQRFRLVLLGP